MASCWYWNSMMEIAQNMGTYNQIEYQLTQVVVCEVFAVMSSASHLKCLIVFPFASYAPKCACVWNVEAMSAGTRLRPNRIEWEPFCTLVCFVMSLITIQFTQRHRCYYCYYYFQFCFLMYFYLSVSQFRNVFLHLIIYRYDEVALKQRLNWMCEIYRPLDHRHSEKKKTNKETTIKALQQQEEKKTEKEQKRLTSTRASCMCVPTTPIAHVNKSKLHLYIK